MGVRIGAEKLVCGDEVGEGICSPSWTTTGRRVGEKEVEGGRVMEEVANMGLQWRRAGIVDGFHNDVVCGGLALKVLAVMCLKENLRMFVAACIIEVELSKAADFIDDVLEKRALDST